MFGTQRSASLWSSQQWGSYSGLVYPQSITPNTTWPPTSTQSSSPVIFTAQNTADRALFAADGSVTLTGRAPELIFISGTLQAPTYISNPELTVYLQRTTSNDVGIVSLLALSDFSDILDASPPVCHEFSYAAHIDLVNGTVYFQKMIVPGGLRPVCNPSTTPHQLFWGDTSLSSGVPFGVTVGLKFTVRRFSGSGAMLELWRDLSGGRGEWRLVDSFFDCGNTWGIDNVSGVGLCSADILRSRQWCSSVACVSTSLRSISFNLGICYLQIGAEAIHTT